MGLTRPKVGVCLIVRRDGKVLLHKRKGGSYPGKWGFPGGHLEMLETFKTGALRELSEEAGPNIKVTEPQFYHLSNNRDFKAKKHTVCIFLICNWYHGEAITAEPDKNHGWQWFSYQDLPENLMDGILSLKSEKGNFVDEEIY